jgi:phytoene synthase
MRSMRLDCAPVRIETWDELVGYMEGSAGSVGRIMAPLLGVPEPHRAGFGRLGLAFQHANFVRDVREDRRLDRIYLPAEERRRFGVADEDFDRPAATPELRALVAHEVRRARGLFASAESAVEAAPVSVRPGIRLACTIYLGVLDRVEALGYDVLGRRPRLPAWQLPLVALAALRR